MLSFPLLGWRLARAKRPAKDPKRLEPPGVVTEPCMLQFVAVLRLLVNEPLDWPAFDGVVKGLTSFGLSMRLDTEVAVTSKTS